MKHCFLAFLFFGFYHTFGQTANEVTSEDTLSIKVAEADSILEKIELFGEEYAKIMATWSPEKIKRFNETFVYTRGHITIPEKPIEWKNEEE
jgi:hypothetical protein